MRSSLKLAVFKGLTWMLGEEDGLVTLPVLKGPAKGLKFRLDLIHRMESAYFLGKYDARILARISEVCRPGDIVWDCGTYLGFYTAFFARLVGPQGRVFGFEPDPGNLARTRHNAGMNGLSNVEMMQAAVGAPCGEIEFILSDGSNSHLPGFYIGETRDGYRTTVERECARIRVMCHSLDQIYLDRHVPAPALIKVDIEGAEIDALRNMDRLVMEVRPLMVLELHNPEADREAWRFARRYGYRLESLADGRILQAPGEVGGTLLCHPE